MATPASQPPATGESPGCAAAQLQQLQVRASREAGGGRWLVTNLDQRDTIMGADAKLRAAVAAVHHRYPIFKLLAGRGRETTVPLWLLAALSLLFYLFYRRISRL